MSTAIQLGNNLIEYATTSGAISWMGGNRYVSNVDVPIMPKGENWLLIGGAIDHPHAGLVKVVWGWSRTTPCARKASEP